MPDQIEVLKKKMLQSAKGRLAADLGIKAEDITGELDIQLKKSLDKQFATRIKNRGIESAVASSFYSTDTLKKAAGRIELSVRDLLATSEFDAALKKNAEMLFKTYKSFLDAGFSESQAFEITITQLKSR